MDFSMTAQGYLHNDYTKPMHVSPTTEHSPNISDVKAKSVER